MIFVIKSVHPHPTRVADLSQAWSDRVCTSARAMDRSDRSEIFTLQRISLHMTSNSMARDFLIRALHSLAL